MIKHIVCFKLKDNSDAQVNFINSVISGVNMPDMKEEDAIAKLKELGYDTSRIEESLKSQPSNNVVAIAEADKTDPNA